MGNNQDKYSNEQKKIDIFYNRLYELKKKAIANLENIKHENDEYNSDTAKSERDSYAKLYTDQIVLYSSVHNQLCFGKLESKEKKDIYIGKIGIRKSNQKQLLIDWRTPIAEAFYRATPENNMGIKIRRHISLVGTKIAKIYDDNLQNYLSNLKEQNQENNSNKGINNSALKEKIYQKRTGRMQEIVSTIQKEQDEIIRHSDDNTFVVNGAPGTGKTIVALHRAAYLLYSLGKEFIKNGILILGPSKVFSNYISGVLPSLGENNIYITTPENLLSDIKPKYDDSDKTTEIKGQLKMAEILKNAVLNRIRIINNDEKIKIGSGNIIIKQIDIYKAQSQVKKQNKKYNDARIIFLNKMIDILAKQFIVSNHLASDHNNIKDEQIEYGRDVVRSNEKINRILNLCWMPLSEKKVLNNLLTKKDYLIQCSKGIMTPKEIKALLNVNKEENEFSKADIALLDELQELLGVEQNGENNQKDESIEYIKNMLYGYGQKSIFSAEELYNRYEGEYSKYINKDDEKSRFRHIIVDEAQDVSPMQWRMISRRSINKSMTIVGDLAQSHYDFFSHSDSVSKKSSNNSNALSWKDNLAKLIGNEITVKNLSVNYRTPKAIMDYAQQYGIENNLNITKVHSVKEINNALSFSKYSSVEDIIKIIKNTIFIDGEILSGSAVIVNDLSLIEELQNRLSKMDIKVNSILAKEDILLNDISVITAKDAKGLEFDNVFVINPNSHKPSDLYVAFTRASKKLVIISKVNLTYLTILTKV